MAVALAEAVLSVGLLLRWPVATQIWPVSVTPLTYTFLAAYVLGFVVAVVWLTVTRELAGMKGIGLTTAVAFGATLVVLGGMSVEGRQLVATMAAAAILCLAGVATLAVGMRQPVRGDRLTPAPVRAACLIVCGLLLVLGVPLILRVPEVMPWALDLNSGALIGCLFLGSATYFLYGALRPEWPHAAGPLAALLAYDLVLTLPLIAHLPTARPEHVTVLLGYIAVLLSTGLLGAYVFLVDRRTRVGAMGRRA